ncbi:hypothetical protein CFP56_011363 [Quercus suber]|uniref:Uncharacterized protein n=1 Tax=Quercus suber TaxID=58331 RepID=A0AAW0MCE9_QUESU
MRHHISRKILQIVFAYISGCAPTARYGEIGSIAKALHATERLAHVAPSTRDLHRLNGGDELKSTSGFWTLHQRLDTGDFHTDAALIVPVVSIEFVSEKV